MLAPAVGFEPLQKVRKYRFRSVSILAYISDLAKSLEALLIDKIAGPKFGFTLPSVFPRDIFEKYRPKKSFPQ